MVVLKIALLIFLSYIYQSSSLSFIFPVQLFSLIAFFYSFKREGAVISTVSGIVRDILLGVPPGTYGLSLTLASLITMKISREINPRGKVFFLLLLFFLFLKDLIAYPVLSIFSLKPPFSIYGYIATIIFYIPIYWANERKNR